MKFYKTYVCGQFHAAAILPRMTEPFLLTHWWGDCADPRGSMDFILKRKVSAPAQN